MVNQQPPTLRNLEAPSRALEWPSLSLVDFGVAVAEQGRTLGQSVSPKVLKPATSVPQEITRLPGISRRLTAANVIVSERRMRHVLDWPHTKMWCHLCVSTSIPYQGVGSPRS